MIDTATSIYWGPVHKDFLILRKSDFFLKIQTFPYDTRGESCG